MDEARPGCLAVPCFGGQKSGYTYSQSDALTAATALVHDHRVVTRNTGDFQRAGVWLINPWSQGP